MRTFCVVILMLCLAGCTQKSTPTPEQEVDAYYHSAERQKLLEGAFKDARDRLVKSIQVGKMGVMDKYGLSPEPGVRIFPCLEVGQKSTYEFADDTPGPVAFCSADRKVWLVSNVSKGKIIAEKVRSLRIGDAAVYVDSSGELDTMVYESPEGVIRAIDQHTRSKLEKHDQRFLDALKRGRAQYLR